MANYERKYNEQTGGFDYFVDGAQVDANAYTEANGGNWWNTLSGSNRKEDNLQLSGMLKQSGVEDGGASKGVLQAQNFNQIGSQENMDNFTKIMLAVQNKHREDKKGEKILRVLDDRLLDMDIDNERLKGLPVDVRQAVQKGEMDRLLLDKKRITAQIAGRASAKLQAFETIERRYDQKVAAAQREQDRELEQFRFTISNFGAEAFADWPPEAIGRLERKAGVSFGTLNSQVGGARRVKAEQERLRQEEIAREEERFNKQFERSVFESDRAFNAQEAARKADDARQNASLALQREKFAFDKADAAKTDNPGMQAMASFRDMLSKGEVAGKRIATRGEETDDIVGEGIDFVTREDAIRYYQGLYGDFINPDDIAMMVYQTYAD